MLRQVYMKVSTALLLFFSNSIPKIASDIGAKVPESDSKHISGIIMAIINRVCEWGRESRSPVVS